METGSGNFSSTQKFEKLPKGELRVLNENQ